mgnify:CR=1 FL=1
MADIQKGERAALSNLIDVNSRRKWYREQAAKLHPNKTGFTEAQGFCSCGQFQIASEGICRRCSRELAAEIEKAAEEKKTRDQLIPQTNRLSSDDVFEYTKHLGEASDVIKDLMVANEKLLSSQPLLNTTNARNTQAIRIENARNRAAEHPAANSKPQKKPTRVPAKGK